jgi:hypothetical protein
MVLLEAVVKRALGKYFSIFFKNFNKDDLNLRFFSGQASLKNIGIDGNYKHQLVFQS